MNSGMNSCGDSMFSGHTASLIVLSGNFNFCILFYTFLYFLDIPRQWSFLKYFIWFWTFIAVICVITSHMHYTMDIVFGIWISRHIFMMYYQIVFLQEIYNANLIESNHLSNDEFEIISPNIFYQLFGFFVWLNPIFMYFEKDAVFQENVLKSPINFYHLYNKIKTYFVYFLFRRRHRPHSTIQLV